MLCTGQNAAAASLPGWAIGLVVAGCVIVVGGAVGAAIFIVKM